MAEKRAVAFLDILGFKNQIEESPLDDLVKKYETIVMQARASLRPFSPKTPQPTLFPNRSPTIPWCTQHIFSDSIILVANGDSDDDCLALLVYTRRLMQHFIAVGMPLRGAIYYDEMYSNINTGVFLGKALTNAYKLEQAQNWIGISIDETVRNRYRTLFQFIDDPKYILHVIFLKYAAPLKNGQTYLTNTINWRYNYIVQKGTRSLFANSNDAGVQLKIANTLTYAKAVIDYGLVYCQDDGKAPIELRAMFVGSKEPPFDHGDDL